MIIFWTIAKSAVFPIIVFQRTRDTHNLYCMDGDLLKLKCSNILKYRFLTFISCKLLSSKLKQKKLLKCFTLHVMNQKYMKVSLFEISYKKKYTFHHIFLDVPVLLVFSYRNYHICVDTCIISVTVAVINSSK